MNCVALLKAENVIYLLLNRHTKPSSILGFRNTAEGVRYFERAYESKHMQSYEGSMSACINFMFFQFSIVEAPDMEFIKNKILTEEPEAVNISNVAGYYLVAKTREGAEKTLGRRGKTKIDLSCEGCRADIEGMREQLIASRETENRRRRLRKRS